MISSTIVLLIHFLASIWSAANLNVCQGFNVHTQYRLRKAFSRKLPTLRFQDDDTLVAAAPNELAAALLEGKVVPLLDAEAAAAMDTVVQDEEVVVALSKPTLRFQEDGNKAIDSRELRTHTSSNTRKLDYNEIQNIIDVSKPYYKLDNEIQVDTFEAMSESGNGSLGKVMRNGFVCTVDPEMAIGREGGSPISCAEAGRHMAIAGSVAAALNQSSNKNGKFYFLAMDCHLEGASDPVASAHMQQCSTAGLSANKQDKCVISAVCCELTNRKAACNIMMQFPKDYRVSKPYYLRVEYTVLSPKLFTKFYPPLCLDQQETKKHPTCSPYSKFAGLPIDSFDLLSRSDTHVKLGNSSIKKVPSEICLGHFDGNPAFPIAFMSAYCTDLCGVAISALTEKVIHFETALTGHGMERNGNVLKFVSAKVDAYKLVQAESHGITLSCEATKDKTEDSSDIFSCDVSIDSLEPEGQSAVAKMQFKFELIS